MECQVLRYKNEIGFKFCSMCVFQHAEDALMWVWSKLWRKQAFRLTSWVEHLSAHSLVRCMPMRGVPSGPSRGPESGPRYTHICSHRSFFKEMEFARCHRCQLQIEASGKHKQSLDSSALCSHRQWIQFLKLYWIWRIPSPPCFPVLPSTRASIRCFRTNKLRWDKDFFFILLYL